MRKLRTTLAPIAALIMALIFVLPAAAQPSGPGLVIPAPDAEYVLSDNSAAAPLLQAEFVLGVTSLVTTTQTIEMEVSAPGDFLVLDASGGYTKEVSLTVTYDSTNLGSLYQIDPNGQPLVVTFTSDDDQPGYTIQLQSLSMPAPDPNATAAAPAGSGITTGGGSLPATAGDSADDLSLYLNQQQVDPTIGLQAFPFKIDGRHALALAVVALGAIALVARRRRRAAR